MIFTDLAARKEARVLGLQSQLRRSVVSIPSNIAEGYGRKHHMDTVQFFYIAQGSAYELENDLSFIDEPELAFLLDKLSKVRLAGLVNHQKSQISN